MCNKKLIIASILVCVAVETVWSRGAGQSCSVENDLSAVAGYCWNYLECTDGVYVIKTCRNGLAFDEKAKECLPADPDSRQCLQRCRFTEKIPVEGSNTKYEYCDYGRIVYGECDFFFDRLLKECSVRIDFADARDYAADENWSDCRPGTKSPVAGSCSSYMECDSLSVWISKQCPRFQNFHPGSLNCVRPAEYYCVEGGTSSGPTSYPTGTEFPSYTTSQTSISPSYDPSTLTISTNFPTEQWTMISSTFEPSSTKQDFSTTFEPASVTPWNDDPTTEESTSETSSGSIASSSPSTNDIPSSSPSTFEPSPISTTTVKPSTSTATTTTLPTTASTPSTAASTTTLPTTASTPSTAASTTTSKTTASTTTSVYTTTLEPQCTKEGEKKVYAKGDCKDYLECDSGSWVKKSCSFGYDFDVNKLACIWSWWAKC